MDQNPRRIHVIGGPGAGKSTLAGRIGAALNLPVYELDRIAFEGPEYRDQPLSRRLKYIHDIAGQPGWVTEGIFVGWTDELLSAADVIIWIDHVPWRLAFTRIIGRFVQGSLSEARRQMGIRKFTRFSDYRRHLVQLLSVFSSSRAYYQSPESTKLHDYQQLTRRRTAEHLRAYRGKVIHCVRAEDVELAFQRVTHLSTSDFATEEPLISIIVNNHNYARFLPDAIESALRQQYENKEVIVVDDGSTDTSRAIIAQFGSRITPILKDNGGQASAFNAGFEVSKGDAVMFLDADDVLLPYTLTHVARIFATEPHVAKVQCRMEIIDDLGTPTGEVLPPPHLRLPNGDLRRSVLSFPEDMTWMATSANTFSRAALSQILPMSESAYDAGGADWYLSHLSALIGNVVSLDLIGAYYRVHDTNLYHRSRPALDQIHRTIHYMQTTRYFLQDFYRRQPHVPLGPIPHDVPGESVSLIAHRLISLKLDPSLHPIAGDTPWKLLRHGVAAALRRFDARVPMKLLYIAWFALMVLLPRRPAMPLIDVWLYPERRRMVNGLLGTLHRK